MRMSCLSKAKAKATQMWPELEGILQSLANEQGLTPRSVNRSVWRLYFFPGM